MYRFSTGKLYRVFDETLHMYAELQQVSHLLCIVLLSCVLLALPLPVQALENSCSQGNPTY